MTTKQMHDNCHRFFSHSFLIGCKINFSVCFKKHSAYISIRCGVHYQKVMHLVFTIFLTLYNYLCGL
jgi:hypothetical protein